MSTRSNPSLESLPNRSIDRWSFLTLIDCRWNTTSSKGGKRPRGLPELCKRIPRQPNWFILSHESDDMITGMECFRQWTVIIAIPFILPAAVAAAASGCWSVASYVCVFLCASLPWFLLHSVHRANCIFVGRCRRVPFFGTCWQFVTRLERTHRAAATAAVQAGWRQGHAPTKRPLSVWAHSVGYRYRHRSHAAAHARMMQRRTNRQTKRTPYARNMIDRMIDRNAFVRFVLLWWWHPFAGSPKTHAAQVSGRLGLKAAAQHEARLIYGVLEAVSVFGGKSSRPCTQLC